MKKDKQKIISVEEMRAMEEVMNNRVEVADLPQGYIWLDNVPDPTKSGPFHLTVLPLEAQDFEIINGHIENRPSVDALARLKKWLLGKTIGPCQPQYFMSAKYWDSQGCVGVYGPPGSVPTCVHQGWVS